MEIVWVFGSSGAGKETLIRGLSRQGEQLELIKKLGWEEKPVVVCEASLLLVAQHENDPVLEQRKALANMVVPMASDPESVVLVKGQDVDLERGIPSQVKQLLPKASHRIIFVDVPMQTLFARWKKKPWWNDDFTLKTVKQWQDYQVDFLLKLQNDFPITTVRSVDADTYQVLDGLQAS